MTITMMKQYFPKQAPLRVVYRNMKNIDSIKFREELKNNLELLGNDITYTQFEQTFMGQLDKYAQIKEKSIRANSQPFMNKTINKAIMYRFIKNPTNLNEYNYKRHRNYVVNLIRREKKKYFASIDTNKISDGKRFWKTIKPLFSDKNNVNEKITLIDDGCIIAEDSQIAVIMNNFFSNVKNLDIQGFIPENKITQNSDNILSILEKFKNHPSILKIKEKVQNPDKISLTQVCEKDIVTEINNLTLENQPLLKVSL